MVGGVSDFKRNRSLSVIIVFPVGMLVGRVLLSFGWDVGGVALSVV